MTAAAGAVRRQPRWRLDVGFLHHFLDDVPLIPVFLPPVLWLHRRLGLRRHDRPPTVAEVAVHAAVWSPCFLVPFPRFPWL